MLKDLFFKYLAQTSLEPPSLDIVRGEGINLYDRSGKKYIDLISGISVSSTGHCNPVIIDAVCRQVKDYTHVMVYGEDILEPQVILAQKLVELTKETVDNVYFVNSGTEAVEGAVKLAKRYTGRPLVVSFKNCYHGSSHLCLSLMTNNPLNLSYRPLVPGIYNFPINSDEAVDFINEKCACVIIEPVQGEAGANPADDDFLLKLREKCNKTGTLLIYDEVQTGMGRTGKWFAFQHTGTIPDIIIMAKALGGGLPLGCFIAKKEIMKVLSFNPHLGHITTFGGNPVSCAASLAAIKFIEENNLIDSVKDKENLFRRYLVHNKIKRISGRGLLLAVHLDTSLQVKNVLTECLSNGLISDWFLFNDSAMRISPPLTINDDEIKISCETILSALDRI